MEQLLLWLETTGLARTVGESLTVTAWVSATHLIGFTLVMGAGVVSGLRAAGLVLGGTPVAAVAGTASRMLVAGLAISLPTGLALFAPRASYTAASGIFQLKVGLIGVASVYQLGVFARLARGAATSPSVLRASGVLGVALWLSLAVVACWFILFD